MKVKEFFMVTVFGFFSAWFGVLAIPVVLLAICETLDIITGTMAARSRGERIKSRTMTVGLCKKVGIFIAVFVGYLIDVAIASGSYYISWKPPVTELIATLVCFWFIFSEMLSILENLVDIGTVLPPFLVTIVNKLKGDTEAAGNNIPPSSTVPK